MSKLVASALVANDWEAKLVGEEVLAIEVLGEAESDDDEDPPEKSPMLLEKASGSPTCVAAAVSLELESTPIVVYPATEPEKVADAVT